MDKLYVGRSLGKRFKANHRQGSAASTPDTGLKDRLLVETQPHELDALDLFQLADGRADQ